MKITTKQLHKIKFSDAFGESYFIMLAWDADNIKELLYHYMGTNLKCLSVGRKATDKDVLGANARGEYVQYYVIPTKLV